jgi:hypothetical protein
MTMYRTDNHWDVTIVREGTPSPGPDHWHEGGPCPDCPRDDQLVAVVVNGDQALAERICRLLNGHAQAAAEGYQQAIDTLLGVVQRTGSPAAKWAAEYLDTDPDRLGPGRGSEERRLVPVRDGSGSHRLHPTCVDVSAGDEPPGMAWICVSACRMPADSCTCEYRPNGGPDPNCPVHHGRRARGPKPPPARPGCVCDGSGRACPRHGAVI